MTMVLPAVAVCLAAFLLHRCLPVESIIPTSFELWPAAASTNTTMTAVSYAVHGNTSVLKLSTDYPQPLLKPHQVLIRVHASSINPCDFKFRRNTLIPKFIRPLPKIPGEDVAGVIVRLGSGVRVVNSSYSPTLTSPPLLQVGDRVAAMLPLVGARWGAAAEFVAVDASLVAKIGPRTDFISAAAVPLVGLTVLQALDHAFVRDNVVVQSKSSSSSKSSASGKKQKRILIQAGAGGVGTFAIQYAKHVLGMYVVATASAQKAAFLRELGCDEVIDYRSEKFEDVLADAASVAASESFDVVLDPMSWLYESRTLGKNAKVLKPGGHYLNIFSSDWEWNGVEHGNGLNSFFNWMYYKICHLIRPGTAPNYEIVLVVPNGKQLQTIMDLLDHSTIRAVVDRKFHLSDTAAAYEYLEQGHATGKVIIYNDKEEDTIV
jgi:alcohol dehydrogenase